MRSLNMGRLRRFVNVSSFSVYTNKRKGKGRLLDESCEVENDPKGRGDAYRFAKTKQDEIVSCLRREHMGSRTSSFGRDTSTDRASLP